MTQNLNNKKDPATTEPQDTTDKQIVAKQGENVNLSFNAETIISQAIAQNVPVETLERVLAMRRELKAEYAQEAFYKSLAAFQADCPVIQKTKVVKSKDGSIRYKYAPLEAIVTQVGPLLQKHGFSHTETTKDGKVTVKIIHELGHSETSDFEVPINQDAYMNEAQKAASALTFAKRYAFCNAFGILTGDEDDDSLGTNNGDTPKPTPLVRKDGNADGGSYSTVASNLIKDLREADTAEQYKKIAGEIGIAHEKLSREDYHNVVQEAKATVKRIEIAMKKTPKVPTTDSPAAIAMRRGMEKHQ